MRHRQVACAALAAVGVGCGGLASGQCELQKLLAGDGSSNEEFGFSVAVHNDVAVIGTRDDEERSGSAYVFRFDGTQWLEQQKLRAADADDDDLFGQSVAVFGHVIIVGSLRGDDAGPELGAAYIFEFDGDAWIEAHKLTASDGARYFGSAVSIDEDVAVVSALPNAYVFRLEGAEWVEEQTLFIDGENTNAISHDRIVIGIEAEEAACVFRFDVDTWIEEARLTALDPGSDDFGVSVAIASDLVVVGAPLNDDRGQDSGSAYVFRRIGGAWQQEQKLLASDGAPESRFGTDVSTSAGLVIVGSPVHIHSGTFTGAAYLFWYDGEAWSEQEELLGSDSADSDKLGAAVAIHEGVALVAAPGDDDNGDLAGAAYVYSTSASPSGACCLPDGTCIEFEECDCWYTDLGAVWLGPESQCQADQCPDFGACCLPNGTCEVWTEDACVSKDGIWRGADTDCADFNGNGIPDECEQIGPCRSDSNGDGVVDFIDLLTLLSDWGPCP